METDLSRIAETVMVERGFISDFPADVQQQAAAIQGSPTPRSPFQDLRDKQWISIDNDDSRDLDQLTYAEGRHLFVAVADVDALVKKDSPIDRQAAANTTSVYTPTRVFPMLPLSLSTNFTSLNPDVDRAAIVVEMEIGEDGAYHPVNIFPAWVRNKAKLTYNAATQWMESKQFPPGTPKEQLLLQDSLAQAIKNYRYQKGTLNFTTVKLRPIIINAEPVGVKEEQQNRAQELIENCMIAANVSVTEFLTNRQLPTLRRIVRIPKRWDRIVTLAWERDYTLPETPDAAALSLFLEKERQRDPEGFPELSLTLIKLIGRGEYAAHYAGEKPIGHFDLALADYAHTTAPNRRFPDLVMQRLLKSVFYSTPLPYTRPELNPIATHCTEREDAATKVERRMLKSAAAAVLSKQLGRTFPALVTGASEKGIFVRLQDPPIEGKLVLGTQGLDVGDKITVRLIYTNTEKGYIDFEKL